MWPEIKVADDPENIKWENLGYSKKSIMFRKCFITLVACAIMTLSLLGILWAKGKADELKKNRSFADQTKQCSSFSSLNITT